MTGKEAAHLPTYEEDEESDKKAKREREATDKKIPAWHLFRSQFPHLAEELEKARTVVRIDGVRWEETERTKVVDTPSRAKFAGYSPDVIDFIRRCDTEEQALEIIDFLERRKEIDSAHAETLRHQLRTRGLRSFGPKKTWGYYEREG